MNDRFKFRVFSKGTKELLFVLTLGGDFIKATPSLVVTSCRTLKADNCILEQSTGLKDKNGRLIYEGDIVKVTGDCMTIPSYLEGKLAKVIWEINCFCLYFPHVDNSYFGECWDYEVIGNIHENPELLEGQK